MEFFQDIFLRDTIFFLKGMVVGLAVAAPIGPASIMCIRRTINHGFFLGIASGLGVAAADTFYGSIAGFGLTSLTDFIVGWFTKVQFAGGVLLIILGVVFYVVKPPKTTRKRNVDDMLHAFLSTFGMTLANPLILFLFAVVFAAVGLDEFANDIDLVGFLVLGIFSGAMLWWFVLCSALGILHRNVQFTSMAWTNKASGMIIVLLGVYALYGTF